MRENPTTSDLGDIIMGSSSIGPWENEHHSEAGISKGDLSASTNPVSVKLAMQAIRSQWLSYVGTVVVLAPTEKFEY